MPERASKTYKEGETIKGVVYVNSKGELSHNGLSLTVDGTVKLQLNARSVSRFEAFYNSLKPIDVLHQQLELAAPGKIPSGVTEIPFELTLRAKPNKTLYESYHGVFANVQIEIKRSFLSKNLLKGVEFNVEYSERTRQMSSIQLTFPSLLRVFQMSKTVLAFLTFSFEFILIQTKPFTGIVVVERAKALIRSIDIQLV